MGVCLPKVETRQTRMTEFKPVGTSNPVNVYREPVRILNAKKLK